MMDIGARPTAAGGAGTVGIDWPRIVPMARIAEIDHASSRIASGRPSTSGWQDAVEHVDASHDGLYQIIWRSHAHQIAWTIRRKKRQGKVENLEHDLLRLADRQSTDGVAIE